MAKKIRVGLVGVGGMGGCHFYNYEKIENAELVAEHSVRSVPTLVLYRAGRVAWRGSGVVSGDHLADIIARIEKER